MQYSVVSYKKLNDTLAFRLDAEYFRPSVLLYEDRINKLHGITVKEYGCKVVSGPFGSSLKSEAYLSSGIPFVRISDLKDFQIDTDELIYISKNDHNRLSSSKLNVGDLVLSKVGNTIGVVSRVTDDIGECNISENNIGIKFPKNISSDEKIFILTFLNSEAGQSQILRSISGNAQPKLNVSDIEMIKIPHLSNEMIKHTRLFIDESSSLILKSNQFYKEAKQILLSELGLLNWKPKHRLSFIKNFYDTKSANRIDAEYFQPKYDQIIKSVKGYSGGWDILDNLVNIKKSIEPGSDEYQEKGIKFLRVSNLSKFGIDNGSPVYLSEKFYNENKQHQPKQGEILLSKDATPGIAYYLNEKPEEMIVSGGILRLKLKDERVNEDYLTLFLNSILVQEQAERDAGGSVIIHWRPDQIKEVVVPIVKDNIQKQIQQKIQQSFELRNKSKQLLEIAKEGVEMAIEKNEQTAMEWINKNMEGNS